MIAKQLNINDNLQEIPVNSGKAFPVTLHYIDLGNWVEPVVGWHWHEALEYRKNSRENLTRKQPWNRMKDSVKKIET